MADKKDKKEEGKKEGKKNLDKNKIANLILIAGIFFAAGFFVSQYNLISKEKEQNITLEEAKTKTEDFITNNLVQPGTEVEITGTAEEKGLYKINLSVQGQEIESYLTKDGKLFFPQAMNIEEIEAQNQVDVEGTQTTQADIPKQAKPVVETFVMSYCPYGTQIEKGLLPVINLLKDKIDFNFKFVDYAMHDKKEVDENLLQYCLNKMDQKKYYEYLGCFLSSGESKTCLDSTKINQSEVSRCVATTDAQYEVSKKFADKDNWGGQYPPFNIQKQDNEKYGIQGSPTLIINGATVSSSRDPQSLLATVCSSFEEAPVECNQELSSDTPAPGFGSGTTANSASADCEE